MVSGGSAEGQSAPHVTEGGDERFDMLVAVQWRGGQSQSFGATRHSRVIDWLHLDLVTVQQLVASGLAKVGIADHHWNDVARRRHHWQISLGEATL